MVRLVLYWKLAGRLARLGRCVVSYRPFVVLAMTTKDEAWGTKELSFVDVLTKGMREAERAR